MIFKQFGNPIIPFFEYEHMKYKWLDDDIQQIQSYYAYDGIIIYVYYTYY